MSGEAWSRLGLNLYQGRWDLTSLPNTLASHEGLGFPVTGVVEFVRPARGETVHHNLTGQSVCLVEVNG